jgi:S1-C subfamily serine protease
MLRAAWPILLAVTAAHARDSVPSSLGLPKDIKLPIGVTVAVYLPAVRRKNHAALNGTAELPDGNALEVSVTAALEDFFTTSFLTAADDDRVYGLLVDVHPDAKMENGDLVMTMPYTVFSKNDAVLIAGTQTSRTPLAGMGVGGDLFTKAALRTAQQVFAEVVTKLHPDGVKYPAVNKMRDLAPQQIVDREHPVSSGTGFFINAAGEVMTAAHVTHDCVLSEVTRDGAILASKVIASSSLLDLAVIDTAAPAPHFLPLRKNTEIILGEAVTNVGFPLQKILAASPNLTRGNISSRGALEGSLGQFQFSAPIQPGSSGGPVVSDGGELLGVTVGTLNAAKLIASGALPQNVNFALDAKFVAKFLHKNNIAFNETAAAPKGDMQTANEAALSSVVAIKCYQ